MRAVPTRLLRWLFRFGVLALALGGLALLLAGAAVDYESLKGRLDRLAAAGTSPFGPREFAAILQRARLVGWLLLVLAAVAFSLRRPVLDWLAALRDDLRREAAELGAAGADLARRERPYLLTLSLIVLAAIALRLLFLNQPMRYDEAYTWLRLASKPFPIGIAYYPAPNNHLFHTLLVILSSRLFGSDPWALRLPVFTAGVLLVPAAWLAFRMHLGRAAGLLAAAMVAVSPALIDHATNARAYTLVALFFLLLMAVAQRLADRPGPAAWAALVMLSALGLFSVPVMLYPWGVVMLWLAAALLLEARGGERRQRLMVLAVAAMAIGIATFLFYLPALVVSGPAKILANDYVKVRAWSQFLESAPPIAVQVWAEWTRGIPPLLQALAVAGVALSLIPPPGRSARRLHWLLAAILWSAFVLLFRRNFGYPRVWLFLLPLLFGSAAGGWCGLARRLAAGLSPRVGAWAASLAALAWLAVVGFGVVRHRTPLTLNARGHLTDISATADWLQQQLAPGDAVVCQFLDTTLLEFHDRRHGIPTSALFLDPTQARRLWLVVNEAESESAGAVDAAVAPLAAHFGPRRPAATLGDYRIERMERKNGGL